MNELEVDSQVISATFNEQLAVGAGMIAFCVILHGIWLFTLQRMMLGEEAEERMEQVRPLSFRGLGFTLFIVLAIVVIHFIEIWLFAFLYRYVQAQWNFENALYFSTISYATIGYNDASIAHEWRMVGALEGILGVILLGWSTAFFVRVQNRLEKGGRAGRSSTRSAKTVPHDP